MQLILENVRSFAGRHEVTIRPLTIVVGENSSGKTSLLAMLARACDFSYLAMRPNFSISPFDVGNFDSIATLRGARHVPWFSMGFATTPPNPESAVRVVASYRNRAGQPELAEVSISAGQDNLELKLQGQEVHVVAAISPQRTPIRLTRSKPKAAEYRFPTMPLGFAIGLTSDMLNPESERDLAMSVFSWLIEVSNRISPDIPTTQAIAPIRTQPRRTYDELSDTFRPTGDHIPFVMAQAWQKGNEAEKERLRSALRTFGRESGLYDDITIRRLGRSPGDPFQLMVSVAGSRTNLADVGYGVSQSLPITVQSLLMAENRQLLLQQPEVHLHPKAQAALGSLLAQFVASGTKHFVIETHSDFLVNRIRMEVARGRLPAQAVSILFLRKARGRTKVHPMTLDKQGNIVGAPKVYRQFFIDEELRLLSRASSDNVRDS